MAHRRQKRITVASPMLSRPDTVYRRYFIKPLIAGGFCIVRDGHCIQNYVADVNDAKVIIDGLCD